MSFPDQSHIDRVRDALWRRMGGGASVMIGAGFSRCARKARPGASDPPMWREVTREISEKLYPPEDTEDSPAGAKNVSPPGDPLRLAQEYESAFGRSDLHDFLRRLIRDDDHEPDEMHRRLLRLPWRDVFTTNWDTLLERTCSSIPERKYAIVRNKDEIPLGAPPRIVKLPASCIKFRLIHAFTARNTGLSGRSSVWLMFTASEDKPRAGFLNLVQSRTESVVKRM